MSEELPTDRYFPARAPDRPNYAVIAAAVAIVLALVGYVLAYTRAVDETDRDRAACVREQRDVRYEIEAWRELESLGIGGDAVAAQINRLRSVLRRDCNERHPDPGLL